MNTESTPKRTRAHTPTNKSTIGVRISDELCAVLQPLLLIHVYIHRFGDGHPRVSDHRCVDTIFMLYVLHTGCQWAALKATDLYPAFTAYDRVRA
jgi:transposase